MRLLAALVLHACLFASVAAQPAPAEPRPFPAEASTAHQVVTAAGPLSFTALAGGIRVTNTAGAAQADVATLAFLAPDPGGHTRPVTFAINGGPGASSAWLNLGAIGPWRLDVTGATVSPSAPPVLHDNTDTWLDMTDLVFIDPPGTGYSRIVANGDEARRRIYSVGGDISLLADVIRRWLDVHNRVGAPVYVVGESYGGFRAPRLARALATEQGVGVRGIALLSPVIDFAHRNDLWDPMPCVWALPSQVAAAREAASRDAVADAEAYATGEYMADLWRGERDRAAVARVAARVSALLPALDPALVRQRDGCVDPRSFVRELHRRAGRVGSLYDPTITSADPFPAAPRSYAPDPALDVMRPLFTAAMRDEYQRLLHWTPEGDYDVLSQAVNRAWQWGNSPNSPESYGALREALSSDPAFRVLVVHGLYDLVTPYLADKVLLDSVPDLGPPGRIAFRVHPGGHMFYTRDAGRAALHEDGAWLLQPATDPAVR